MFFTLCFAASLAAQNGITGNPDWQFRFSASPGIIIAHRSTINHLVKGYPLIYGLELSKPTSGNKLWHRENNLPDVGLSLQFLDFRNREQLGYAIAAAPFIDIPLNEKLKASRLIFRLSFGVAYMTNPFDPLTNHKNNAISGKYNAFVQFKWFWHLYLNKNLRLEPGFNFTHSSNARANVPNLGLNMVSAGIGLNFRSRNKTAAPAVEKIDSNTRNPSRNEVVFVATTGFTRRNHNGEMLPCNMLSVCYQRNVRNTHKFSAGIDCFYDKNYQVDYFNKYNVYPGGADQLRMSFRLGYSYNTGRISFPIEVGYYFFQKYVPDASVVSRLGIRYYSKSGLVAHFGLRTHYAVAYNFEYGLGYRYFFGK